MHTCNQVFFSTTDLTQDSLLGLLATWGLVDEDLNYVQYPTACAYMAKLKWIWNYSIWHSKLP